MNAMNPSRTRKSLSALCLALPLLAAPSLFAQRGPDGHGAPGGGPMLTRALSAGRPGRWWDDPTTAQQIGLSTRQQQQMDSIFQEHRLKLIDMRAALEKQETVLEPLLESAQPDKSKVMAQIDAVADARAGLEKADAHMLLDLREVLNAGQWQKLQAIAPPPPGNFRRPGGPGAPGAPGGPGAPEAPGSPGATGAPASAAPPPPPQ